MDHADVREAIYDALCTIPAIWDSSSPPQGKVFFGWTAPADTEKPFIVFNFQRELPTINKCGVRHPVEVLVLGEPTDYLAVDPIADAVISVLHHQNIPTPLGGSVRLCYQRDSYMDIHVEELKADGVRLLFLTPLAFWA